MAPAIICWFVLGCSAHKHRLWQHSQQDVTLSSCIRQNYSCCFMKGELILRVEAWPYPSQASVATDGTCWWINARLQYLQCVSNDDIKGSKWCQNCLDELKSIWFFLWWWQVWKSCKWTLFMFNQVHKYSPYPLWCVTIPQPVCDIIQINGLFWQSRQTFSSKFNITVEVTTLWSAALTDKNYRFAYIM